MKLQAVCRNCGGDSFEAKAVTLAHRYKGQVFIIENVPAEVCTQCGEDLLSVEVAKAIQSLVWGETPPDRYEKVPVYDLARRKS